MSDVVQRGGAISFTINGESLSFPDEFGAALSAASKGDAAATVAEIIKILPPAEVDNYRARVNTALSVAPSSSIISTPVVASSSTMVPAPVVAPSSTMVPKPAGAPSSSPPPVSISTARPAPTTAAAAIATPSKISSAPVVPVYATLQEEVLAAVQQMIAIHTVRRGVATDYILKPLPTNISQSPLSRLVRTIILLNMLAFGDEAGAVGEQNFQKFYEENKDYLLTFTLVGLSYTFTPGRQATNRKELYNQFTRAIKLAYSEYCSSLGISSAHTQGPDMSYAHIPNVLYKNDSYIYYTDALLDDVRIEKFPNGILKTANKRYGLVHKWINSFEINSHRLMTLFKREYPHIPFPMYSDTTLRDEAILHDAEKLVNVFVEKLKTPFIKELDSEIDAKYNKEKIKAAINIERENINIASGLYGPRDLALDTHTDTWLAMYKTGDGTNNMNRFALLPTDTWPTILYKMLYYATAMNAVVINSKKKIAEAIIEAIKYYLYAHDTVVLTENTRATFGTDTQFLWYKTGQIEDLRVKRNELLRKAEALFHEAEEEISKKIARDKDAVVATTAADKADEDEKLAAQREVEAAENAVSAEDTKQTELHDSHIIDAAATYAKAMANAWKTAADTYLAAATAIINEATPATKITLRKALPAGAKKGNTDAKKIYTTAHTGLETAEAEYHTADQAFETATREDGKETTKMAGYTHINADEPVIQTKTTSVAFLRDATAYKTAAKAVLEKTTLAEFTTAKRASDEAKAASDRANTAYTTAKENEFKKYDAAVADAKKEFDEANAEFTAKTALYDAAVEKMRVAISSNSVQFITEKAKPQSLFSLLTAWKNAAETYKSSVDAMRANTLPSTMEPAFAALDKRPIAPAKKAYNDKKTLINEGFKLIAEQYFDTTVTMGNTNVIKTKKYTDGSCILEYNYLNRPTGGTPSTSLRYFIDYNPATATEDPAIYTGFWKTPSPSNISTYKTDAGRAPKLAGIDFAIGGARRTRRRSTNGKRKSTRRSSRTKNPGIY